MLTFNPRQRQSDLTNPIYRENLLSLSLYPYGYIYIQPWLIVNRKSKDSTVAQSMKLDALPGLQGMLESQRSRLQEAREIGKEQKLYISFQQEAWARVEVGFPSSNDLHQRAVFPPQRSRLEVDLPTSHEAKSLAVVPSIWVLINSRCSQIDNQE